MKDWGYFKGMCQAAVLLLASVFSFPPVAYADTLLLTGGSGVVANGFYVGPYSGIFNGKAVEVICDDYVNRARFGQSHEVIVSTFSDLSRTLYGAGGGMLDKYRQVAWLADQFAISPTSMWGAIHFALWSIFNPSVVPLSPEAQIWRDQAILHATGNSALDHRYLIFTPVVPGASQEFLSPITTPEPGSILLLAAAVIAVALLARRNTATPA